MRTSFLFIALILLIQPMPVFAVTYAGDVPQDRQEALTAILDSLPDCRDRIHNISFRFDRPELAGHMDLRGDVWLASDLSEEDMGHTLRHECGHIQDMLVLTGNPRSGLSPFSYKRNVVFKDDSSVGFYSISWESTHAPKSDKGFVSPYAMTDCFEDFAETYRFFQEGGTSKDPIIRKKLAWMKANL